MSEENPNLKCAFQHVIAEANGWDEDGASAMGYDECDEPVYVLRDIEEIGETVYLCKKHERQIIERRAELVDRMYASLDGLSGLTEAEQREFDVLEAKCSEMDAAFYGPIIKKLQAELAEREDQL